MAFQDNETQILISVQQIADQYCRKNAQAVDEKKLWPEENIKALKEARLSGLLVSPSLGGMGQGLLTMAKSCEILGEACASTSMCFGMHLVGSAVMAAKATEAQKEKFLRPIAEGKHWTTLALSEPGTGSHFYLPQTKMARDKSEVFTLNGAKSFVTNGMHADSYVVSTSSEMPNHNVGEFSCVIVPDKTPGLNWGENWEGMGMRGNSSRKLILENVSVPESFLLGSVGDQIWYVFEVVAPNFLIAMSGTYLGIATAALKEAITHITNRNFAHDGESLAALPLIQHRIGVLWSQVERTRQLVYSAASLGDQSDPAALLSIMSAKAEVAECAVSIVNEAMTLMGGITYGSSTSMGRHLRDARAAHVMAPTTDILRTWTGRALLGVPLLGD